LPPEEIKWLATSGIITTSEPVRARIVSFTRSISAATNATSASTPELFDASLNGATTPTGTTLPKAQSTACARPPLHANLKPSSHADANGATSFAYQIRTEYARAYD
jgi:hypothetical protein